MIPRDRQRINLLDLDFGDDFKVERDYKHIDPEEYYFYNEEEEIDNERRRYLDHSS